MISKEEYAALREQIIAELKEEKRARDQARIKLNEAVATMFDETARTYLPKLMSELKRKGYAIKTTMRTAKNRYNKPTSFAVYTLAE